jgi:hypothetical protein
LFFCLVSTTVIFFLSSARIESFRWRVVGEGLTLGWFVRAKVPGFTGRTTQNDMKKAVRNDMKKAVRNDRQGPLGMTVSGCGHFC